MFSNGQEQKASSDAALIARLYQEIGQLKDDRQLNILDAPMATPDLKKFAWTGPLRAQAGDGVRPFHPFCFLDGTAAVQAAELPHHGSLRIMVQDRGCPEPAFLLLVGMTAGLARFRELFAPRRGGRAETARFLGRNH